MRVPDGLRRSVRFRAAGRCEYCLHAEWLIGLAHQLDHVHPRSLGGPTAMANLALACAACNSAKAVHTQGADPIGGELVLLFNPRQQLWHEHFRWREDGRRIEGLTACGRATVGTLNINHPLAVAARTVWASIGVHPPQIDEPASES